jgi:hypothetical protein
MLKKIFVFTIILGMCTGITIGQDVSQAGSNDKSAKKKKEYISAEYIRPGISAVFSNDPQHKYSRYLSKAEVIYSVPDNFDGYPLENANINGQNFENNLNAAAKEVIASLFDRQADGSFTQNILNKRITWAASQGEAELASQASDEMTILLQKGMKLIDNVHIVVFFPDEIITMDEYYDREDARAREAANKSKSKYTPVERKSNGYTGSLKYKMYKIHLSDTNAAFFLENIYHDRGMYKDNNQEFDRLLPEKVSNWNEYKVVMSKVYEGSTGTSATYSRETKANERPTDQELFNRIVSNPIYGVLEHIAEGYKPFHLKAKVVTKSPVGAKIGKKENLKLDSRFFVYEQRQDKNEQLYSHKVGVVRSYWIADNRFDVTDKTNKGKCDTSLFFQTAGGRIREGMFLERKPDAGLAIAFGYSFGNLDGVNFRVEYNLAGIIRKKGGALEFWKGYKTGFDFTFSAKNDLAPIPPFAPKVNNYIFMRLMWDQSIEWVVARNFSLAPIAGAGAEFAFQKKEKNETNKWGFMTFMANAGVRGGMNLTHNIQLQGTFKYHFLIANAFAMPPKDSNAESKYLDKSWDELFTGRKGATMNLSLRFSF